MKRLTTFLFVFLFAFACFGQRVLTYDGKVLTYGGKVLYQAYAYPDEIAGLQFWLDGQDASTVSLNGNKVIQWDDKSGFDRHVANAVDAQRPTYDPVTGRVTFVAANSTYLQSAAFAAALAQPITIYILYRLTILHSARIFDGIANDFSFRYHNVANLWYINTTNILSIANINTNDNIHCGEFNGLVSNYRINGVNCPLCPANVGVTPLDGITLGCRLTFADYANAEIMEVFGYNRSLSASERTQLTNYLQDKWSLSLWLILLLIPNVFRKEEEYKIAA